MKKSLFLITLFCVSLGAFAAQTTYTFTSKTWTSKVGTVATDGKTDGWVCDSVANGYVNGMVYADGSLHTQGVHVVKGCSGAGATSVIDFTNVRKIVVNFCQNEKKGVGTLCFQIGDNDTLKVPIAKPESNGSLNRDVEIAVPAGQSGKISFAVECSENAIYINTINIKADNASPNVQGLTMDTYRLVTDVNKLQVGDKVIFGVADNSINRIMGLFDESVSKNNIHAINGIYSADRSTVNEQIEAIYTVGTVEIDGKNYFTFADYFDWYLVASGGKTKNRLAVWDTICSSEYGWNGAWAVEIASDGAATVTSQGTSLGKIIQYNYNGGVDIFGCYENPTYKSLGIYKHEIIENPTAPYIASGMVNFGTILLDEAEMKGSKTIEVNAINLTENISASLKIGTIFSIDKSELDRDGDKLTVSYKVTDEGYFVDTLVLESGTAHNEFIVSLTADKRMTIAEAKEQDEVTTCYLQPVTVTKKYDKYIFVQDETGSLQLFDGSNLYGKGLSNGCVLTGVYGRYKNYYGNPSFTLGGGFSSQSGAVVEPELITEIDSADVCRYVRLEEVTFNAQGEMLFGNGVYPLYDLFKYGTNTLLEEELYNIEGIVYYYDKVVFCPTLIELANETAIDVVEMPSIYAHDGTIFAEGELTIYTILGVDVTSQNGNLKGAYVVRVNNKIAKIIVK